MRLMHTNPSGALVPVLLEQAGAFAQGIVKRTDGAGPLISDLVFPRAILNESIHQLPPHNWESAAK